MKHLFFAVAGLGALLLSGAASAQSSGPAWEKGLPEKKMEMWPFAPFRIIDNVYYVGTRAVGDYLIVTPAGDILVNTNFEGTLPLVQKNIEALGFKLSDIKIVLICHGHHDGAGDAAAIVQKTGVKLEVMEQDVPEVETGGKADWITGNMPEHWYPPAKVDRVLHDGDKVELGGTVLTAHFTPGHTKGNTSWGMTAKEGGKSYNVLIMGGMDVHPTYNLINDPGYPNDAADYAKSFRLLKALPVDVFLGNRPEYFNMEEKFAKMKPGGPNVFVDPAGYQAYLVKEEKDYNRLFDKQKADPKDVPRAPH